MVFYKSCSKSAQFLWGISSVGRAPALQAGGHEFESRILHWMKRKHPAHPNVP